VRLYWSTIFAYLGIPLAMPRFIIVNVGTCFTLIMYVVNPMAYWFNAYNAKTFPIFSKDLFTSTREILNISKIVDSHFLLDLQAYKEYGFTNLCDISHDLFAQVFTNLFVTTTQCQVLNHFIMIVIKSIIIVALPLSTFITIMSLLVCRFLKALDSSSLMLDFGGLSFFKTATHSCLSSSASTSRKYLMESSSTLLTLIRMMVGD
jgi:hypothetical protein